MDPQNHSLESSTFQFSRETLGSVHLPPPRKPFQSLPINTAGARPASAGAPKGDYWMFKPYPHPEHHSAHHHSAGAPQLMTPQTTQKAKPPPEELQDDGRKPPYSYAMLIGMAILRSPQQRLTLSQIYSWINETFSYYRNSSSGWQNSIRHNLSLSKAFAKQHRPKNDPGKGNYWTVAPGYETQFENPVKRNRGTDSKRRTEPQRAEPMHAVKLPQATPKQEPSQLQPPTPGSPGLALGPPVGSFNAPMVREGSVGSHSSVSSITSSGSVSAVSAALSAPDMPAPSMPSSMPSFTLGTSPSPNNKRSAPSPLDNPSKRLLFEMPNLQPPPTVWMPQVHKPAPIVWDEPSPARSAGGVAGAMALHLGGSPSQSLDAHRRYINQLCTPSFEFQEMSSPKFDDSWFGPSPRRDAARRRLFCENPPLEEHMDMFVADSGNKPMFTPIRRPFDTPIRDQSYVFSPAKTPYGDGSPRRR